MELIKKEIEVPKETMELADALASVVMAVREAVKDGWQTGTDLPAVLAAAVTKLPAALEGVDKLGEELKADKGKMVLALAVALDKAL